MNSNTPTGIPSILGGRDVPGTKQETSHVAGRVGQVLGNTEQTSAEISYTLPSFIIQKKEGIFINLEKLPYAYSFGTFLENIFNAGYYLVDIHYPSIEAILYSFEKTKQFCQKRKESALNPEVRLASGLKKIPEERKPLYERGLRISPDKNQVDYEFGPIYLDQKRANGKTQEVELKENMNIDEFIASMWKHGIRFGFDIGAIKENIQKRKIGFFHIAKGRVPTDGTNATIKTLISFKNDAGFKETSGGKLDVYVQNKAFTQVEINTPLYEKIPMQHGVVGWDIHGTHIAPKEPDDITLAHLVGIGTRLKIEDNRVQIIATRTGYPKENRDPRGNLLSIDIHDKMVFDGNIGPETGDIMAFEDVVTKGNINRDYLQKGKNIGIGGDVSGNIHAIENIAIAGNVHGNIGQNITSKQHRQGGTILSGHVISDTGNITIKGRADGASIEAKKRIVRISNAENSTIVADRVEITGSAYNCIIIAREIIINGQVSGCSFLTSERIEIQESIEKRNGENICSIYSLDLHHSIEKKEELLKKENEIVGIIENKIDTLLIAGAPKIITVVPEKDRRLRLIRIFIEMLDDENNSGNEKNKPYIVLFTIIKPLITKILKEHTNWNVLKKHLQAMLELTETIKQEKKKMEESTTGQQLSIGYIQGLMILQRTICTDNKELLTIDIEEARNLSNPGFGHAIPPSYRIEKLSIPDQGGFRWKSE